MIMAHPTLLLDITITATHLDATLMAAQLVPHLVRAHVITQRFMSARNYTTMKPSKEQLVEPQLAQWSLEPEPLLVE